ncbi:hypothetical protein NDU88_008257 [Pleurodeles waltl]|uniref:Secreted protein n=1 Tax=Pleurodeles waltl TaxID=8319 RepID=A0AAV7PR44_PLEWA|nr:hypothetical protein NDU88_008257 [Pleurodeles waltl]
MVSFLWVSPRELFLTLQVSLAGTDGGCRPGFAWLRGAGSLAWGLGGACGLPDCAAPGGELLSPAGPTGLAAPLLEWRLTNEVSGGLPLLRAVGSDRGLVDRGACTGSLCWSPGCGSQEEAIVGWPVAAVATWECGSGVGERFSPTLKSGLAVRSGAGGQRLSNCDDVGAE